MKEIPHNKEMINDQIEAIVFDIDGTLTPDISWVMLTRGLGASEEVHNKIFKDYTSDKITYEESKKRLLNLWQQTGNANKKYIEKIFRNIPFREETESIIESLKPHYSLCLITGSLDLYAQVIANRLDIKNFYANTQLTWDGQDNLIDYHYHRNQGDKKLEQFFDFAKTNEIDQERIMIVGDSDNDRELFRQTAKGVALKGESSQTFKKSAWHTIDSLNELLPLLGLDTKEHHR